MGLCNDYFSVELRSFFYHINKFTIATCFAILEKIKTYFKKVRIYLEAVAKFEKKKCKQCTFKAWLINHLQAWRSRESLLGPHRGRK